MVRRTFGEGAGWFVRFVAPLLLTRGVWAGGQRYGTVLWSSDIWSSFEELASQVPQGVQLAALV
jgi:alpha-D-xyloside xylohydrolase